MLFRSTFQTTYQISLDKIALLITFNFGVQLIVDLLASKFVDKIGYKTSILIAHICAAIGLVGLTVFPELMSDPFVGLLIAVSIYAIGGGIIEVLISPIVEACPTERKEATMSLLHSFYCWGHVVVVLVSTLYFVTFGIENWKVLAWGWALIPIMNAVYFAQVPIATLNGDEEGLSLRELLAQTSFWILLVLMICAGASEQALSQWASAFAEMGLGVSKTVGDLAGPLAFATLMGISRVFYAKFSEKVDLQRFMFMSSGLCIISYLLAALSSNPVFGLIGCALCGFSVGILWPGTFSTASKSIKGGGTAMFALLALGGDVGCAGGPTFVGMVSGAFGSDLKMGRLWAIIFPILLIIGLLLNNKLHKNKAIENQETAL